MKTVFAFLTLAFFVQTSHASVVEFTGAPQNLSVSGRTVAVYPELKLNKGDSTQSLKLTGYGIRQKNIVVANINVYLAASYVDVPESLNPTSPLEGLKTAKGRVIVLTLLRTMTAKDIRSAFEDALERNQVDLNSAAVQSVFNQFNGNLKAGESIVLASYPTNGNQEALVIELPNKTITENADFLGLDFWKIWFGESVDPLMASLKASLVGKGK